MIISTLCLSGAYASNQNISEIDEFLLETGMPLDTVKALDEDLKAYIYETIDTTEEITFSGHTEKTITFPNTDGGDIGLNYIPRTELSLTVTGFDSSGTYHIYPTFEWKKLGVAANDTFAFALPDGWELVPKKYNLRMWYKSKASDSWTMVEDLSRPSTANFYGYAWKLPKPKYSFINYYRGNAYIYAEPTKSSPTRKLCISYCDDQTSSASASYTISFGPLSITFGGGGSNVRDASEILGF